MSNASVYEYYDNNLLKTANKGIKKAYKMNIYNKCWKKYTYIA